MVEIKKGDIVINTAGRGYKKTYIVLEIDDEFVYIVDGKNRRIENPKRKNRKHLLLTKLKSEIAIDRQTKDLNSENAKIREELRRISNMEVANV